MKNIDFVCYEPEMLCGILKREWMENKHNYHFLGVPIDISSSYRSGARHGPDNFRRILRSENFECITETGVSLKDYYKIKDWGNIGVISTNLRESLRLISDGVLDLILSKVPFLIFGGDHSLTIGIGHAYKEADLPVYLIYLDAHLDLYNEMMETNLSHACTLRRFSEISNFQGAIVLGYRDFTHEQLAYAKNNNIKVVSTNELIHQSDLFNFGIEIAQNLRNKNIRIHVSVDLDILDPSFAPGVGNPVAGGISTRELMRLLTGIFQGINTQIISWDIVEYNPLYDPVEITAFTAVKLLLESLGAQIQQ
ncbi:MAG: arginase family protein [Candidatus Heimdallarchaeota archaeon]|nr:MAG: arginase family protein [Candidatus Heimdallarchaeota archaeon]